MESARKDDMLPRRMRRIEMTKWKLSYPEMKLVEKYNSKPLPHLGIKPRGGHIYGLLSKA